MYLKRKIDDFLIKWKEDINRKPLIVKGARQIGKTESIMHFANANYTSVIYINFALDKRFIKIAEDGYDVNTIVKNISLINPSFKFVQGNTIIVFDEIQEYPDIATALKSFRIDGRYDIMMFKRRAVLDFSALPAFFVTNLLLVQCENHYFRRLIVSFNC